ncbi:MAG: hypothetical protein VZQ61_06610 [Christensenellaceae bacterium]
MDSSRYIPIQMYCPNCGHKVVGLKSADSAVRIVCDRCKSTIFSKQIRKKEVTLKVVAAN